MNQTEKIKNKADLRSLYGKSRLNNLKYDIGECHDTLNAYLIDTINEVSMVLSEGFPNTSLSVLLTKNQARNYMLT